jgi:hypothetical protein
MKNLNDFRVLCLLDTIEFPRLCAFESQKDMEPLEVDNKMTGQQSTTSQTSHASHQYEPRSRLLNQPKAVSKEVPLGHPPLALAALSTLQLW